jgi:hypothetical protein
MIIDGSEKSLRKFLSDLPPVDQEQQCWLLEVLKLVVKLGPLIWQ